MKRRIFLLFLCVCLILPTLVVCAEEDGVTEETQVPTEASVTEPATETEETVPEETVPEESTEPKNTEVLDHLLSQLTTKVSSEDQRLRQQIMRIHAITLQETEMESLHGYCGLQVAWEIYLLGITRSLISLNGKDHYDFYKEAGSTSGGYPVRAYDVEEYSLEEALNLVSRNGTRNVYNMVVGCETTHTEAGQMYGHALFIHAIYNGRVYASEGYATRFGTAEGEPIVLSIPQFAAWLTGWAEYEGLIYFGKGNMLDSFISYHSDMFIQADTAQYILENPAISEGQDLRMVQPGERLQVTGMYEDLAGTFFYQVSDDGQTGYVYADAFYPVLFKTDDVTCSDLVLPEILKEKERFRPGGKITTKNTRLGSVRLVIANAEGEVVHEVEIARDVTKCDLASSKVRQLVDTRNLTPGNYSYCIYADICQQYRLDGEVAEYSQTLCLASAAFTVGEPEMPRSIELPQMEQSIQEGWNYIDGLWYYFENGSPRIGWFCHNGHDYYMDETGAAMTGWQELNGKMRYFGQTGALRTGWFETKEGVYYLLVNGQMAEGWLLDGGYSYYFGEDGKMLCGGWTEIEDKLYYFGANGTAAVGLKQIKGVVYKFHAEGYLLCKQDSKGETVDYDGTWKP